VLIQPLPGRPLPPNPALEPSSPGLQERTHLDLLIRQPETGEEFGGTSGGSVEFAPSSQRCRLVGLWK